ncbi:Cdc6/Cdc18 family protein [Candidatus Magnetobacterium casense]|uniref:AAA family ATPase n=1 Tax=Candidatus Magnetobacterium casense TaxID=1455061 RepID=A0ABS6S314_9BACT|nr:AAA family ATPase [Candidatus Magnetobacterium casensis]MBV6343243.1 AAA family ATPase [Candidatus Magnetobacterium casensis]
MKDMLAGGETLFKNEDALDADYVPKLLPFREGQQFAIAAGIRPLFQGRNGTNCFVYGVPGIGKTVAVKHIFRDLETGSDDVQVVYVNCWQRNTSYQILVEICNELGYAFTQNKRQDELMGIVRGICNKKAAVFCFDEVDKAGDFDFLYSILQDVFKRSVILITNYKEWLAGLEPRVASRLLPDVVEFKSYSPDETRDILKQRMSAAFIPGCWTADAFEVVVERAAQAQDVRIGLFLMRQAGLAAEAASVRRITAEHARLAISKLDQMSVSKEADLADDTKLAFEIIKQSGGGKSGDLFKLYKDKGGEGTYKTFARKIEKLERAGMIKVNTVLGGKEGSTSHITLASAKRLDEF